MRTCGNVSSISSMVDLEELSVSELLDDCLQAGLEGLACGRRAATGSALGLPPSGNEGHLLFGAAFLSLCLVGLGPGRVSLPCPRSVLGQEYRH